MARQLNPDSAIDAHKVSNINALIANAAHEMRAIGAQRKKLNEEAAEIRKNVKEAGITTDAFDYACKMFERESEARDAYMTSLQQCWVAMGIGGQLDFVKALDEPAADGAPSANGKDKAGAKSKPH